MTTNAGNYEIPVLLVCKYRLTFTARTGLPVDIQMKPQTGPPDGYTRGQRPDLVPGQSIYAALHKTIDQWFNPDAFAFRRPAYTATWAATSHSVLATTRSTQRFR